jgi:hypothetical protein
LKIFTKRDALNPYDLSIIHHLLKVQFERLQVCAVCCFCEAYVLFRWAPGRPALLLHFVQRRAGASGVGNRRFVLIHDNVERKAGVGLGHRYQ